MTKSEIYKAVFNNKGIAKSLAKNRRMLPKKARTNPRAKTGKNFTKRIPSPTSA